MSFRPEKSRAMTLKWGEVVEKHCIYLDGIAISSWKKLLETWLTIADKPGLSSRYKVRIYRHGILHQVLCPLLVYKVTLSRPSGDLGEENE